MNNPKTAHHAIHLSIILFLIFIVSCLFFVFTQRATANEPHSTNTVDTALGTVITYQGEIDHNGTPMNGTCAMKFQLFDATSGGNAASSELTKANVPVNAGIFTVELDFGSAPYTGAARYLNIAVKCGGDSNYTTIGSRVALNATPYALSLRPGAVISGTTGPALTGWSNNQSGEAVGLYGYAESNSFAAYGVKGETTQPHGVGVQGLGIYTGVHGATTDSTGTGFGVQGTTVSNAGTGVFGYAAADTGSTNGVRGDAKSSSGTGVYGVASAISGKNYGVYGQTYSASGYGVYSFGNAHVEGDLTWKDVTSYLTIPAAAFQPNLDGYTFTNSGRSVLPTGANPALYFLAPVNLPHGAIVTNITFHWTDTDVTEGALLQLYRIDLAGGEVPMATLVSIGNPGAGSSSENTIGLSTIDNSQYGYYLWLSLPSTALEAHGVVIEYTIDQPY